MMSNENLTHWKKNVDSRYISGEDLLNGLKGLRKEMNVQIVSFKDSESYDQKANQKTIVTAISMVDVDTGQMLYKPMILNKTNARFLEKEFNSPYLENWLNKTFTIYAQPDRRHGHVVRCRRAIIQVDTSSYVAAMNNCQTLDELKNIWGQFGAMQTNPQLIGLKDQLIAKLK